MNEEYILKCHEMAKQLMREFRILEHVVRSSKDSEDRIREYAKYYKQAYDLFFLLGTRQTDQETIQHG